MLIRSGDTVEVITGADRGVKSRVIVIDRAAGKAIVEGVARVYKHVRRSQKHPQGGRLSKEMPVQLSNVAFYCATVRQGRAARRAVHQGRQQGTLLPEVWHGRRADRARQSRPRDGQRSQEEGARESGSRQEVTNQRF